MSRSIVAAITPAKLGQDVGLTFYRFCRSPGGSQATLPSECQSGSGRRRDAEIPQQAVNQTSIQQERRIFGRNTVV